VGLIRSAQGGNGLEKAAFKKRPLRDLILTEDGQFRAIHVTNVSTIHAKC
jgi:hypothetical protein